MDGKGKSNKKVILFQRTSINYKLYNIIHNSTASSKDFVICCLLWKLETFLLSRNCRTIVCFVSRSAHVIINSHQHFWDTFSWNSISWMLVRISYASQEIPMESNQNTKVVARRSSKINFLNEFFLPNARSLGNMKVNNSGNKNFNNKSSLYLLDTIHRKDPIFHLHFLNW